MSLLIWIQDGVCERRQFPKGHSGLRGPFPEVLLIGGDRVEGALVSPDVTFGWSISLDVGKGFLVWVIHSVS